MTLSKRVEALEVSFRKMEQNMTWQTRIGYYMATLISALTFKLLFFGI